MKSFLLLSILAPNALGAAVLQTRQMAGMAGMSMGSVKPTSKLEVMPQRAGAPAGAKRMKGTYGPFTIPAYHKNTTMSQSMGEGGMAMPSMRITPPADDCTYTYVKTDLVYKDGSVANYNTGVWLHHMMVVNVGGGSNPLSAFGGGGAGMPGMFYSIGNDREPVSYPNHGIYLSKGTTFLLSNELAQLNDVDTDVYVTMDYEWLPGKPAGYKNVLAISQDASGRKSHGPAGVSAFTLTSPVAKMGQNATILSQYGHLHDGGINTEVYVNGKLVCNSKSNYGTDPTFIQSGPNSGLQNTALGTPKMIAAAGTLAKVEHISTFESCPGGRELKKGDELQTKVYYNYTERPVLLNLKGGPTELMAISMTFVGIPMPV